MEENKDEELKDETNSNKEEHGKIKSVLKGAKNGVINLYKKGKGYVDERIDEHKRIKDIEESIKNEAYFFIFNDNSFFGFFDIKNPVCIFVPENEKIISKLYSNCVITSKNDNAKYKLISFSKSADETKTIKTEHGDEIIKCYYLNIEIYKFESAPVNNYITNTVTQNINNSSISGDVNLVSNINNDLDRLAEGIKGINLKGLDAVTKRKSKDFVVTNFGVFKDNVTNGVKDESFFSKFIEALGKVAPALVTLATSIIGKM